MEQREAVSTEHLLRTLGPEYKMILVGDARMATWELTMQYGAVYFYERNETPGIIWLKRFSEHFLRSIWLNPVPTRYWNHQTVIAISKFFPMYEFTLDGLREGVRKLVAKR
jgi:hypothetical protein